MGTGKKIWVGRDEQVGTVEWNHLLIRLAGLGVAACFFSCIWRVAQYVSAGFFRIQLWKHDVRKDVACERGGLTSSN